MDSERNKALETGDYDHMVVNIAKGVLSDLSNLYMKLKRPIFVYALSILHDYNAAEDVMQETFLKVTVHANEYKKGTNAKAWILSITRNLSLYALEQQKRMEELPNNFLETVISPEEKVDSTVDFFKLIEPLDEVEKEIIVLRFPGKLRFTEIAEIMKVSPGYIRNRYSRAVKKLKRINSDGRDTRV